MKGISECLRDERLVRVVASDYHQEKFRHGTSGDIIGPLSYDLAVQIARGGDIAEGGGGYPDLIAGPVEELVYADNTYARLQVAVRGGEGGIIGSLREGSTEQGDVFPKALVIEVQKDGIGDRPHLGDLQHEGRAEGVPRGIGCACTYAWELAGASLVDIARDPHEPLDPINA